MQTPIYSSPSARFVVLLLAALCFSPAAPCRAAGQGENEQELIRILKSDASGDQKAIACKKLSIYGTSQAVPTLAPLLADEQLSSWARIALEAIPGSASDAALREALPGLKGKLLVGTINTIGVRSDPKAVASLTKLLKDANPDVASAAAVALGRIGEAKRPKRCSKRSPKARRMFGPPRPRGAFVARKSSWLPTKPRRR